MDNDWSHSANASMGKLPPLEGLFHALLHEGRSVLMVSDDDALLETCGQSVLRKLRQNAEVQVTAMFDLDREVVLQRFNRLLENLSVNEALNKDLPQATVQVWLQQIHNSQELEQAKLLIRLCTDFPSAGVKLLLMANNVCADDLVHNGQAKKMLVWHAPVMQKNQPSKAVATADPIGSANPYWMDESPADPPEELTFLAKSPSPSRAPSSGSSQRWVVQLLLGIFVLVSVVVVALSQWNAETPPVAQVPPSAEPVAKNSQASAPVTTDPAVNVSQIQPIAVQPPEIEAKQESLAVPATPVQSTPTTPTPTPTPEPAKSPVTPPVTESVRWATGLPASSWLVQHVALDTLKDVQLWQSQHPALAKARVVPMRRPNGQTYWVLVSGPFKTLEQANAFAQTAGVPKNPWSRAVASLQANLDKNR